MEDMQEINKLEDLPIAIVVTATNLGRIPGR